MPESIWMNNAFLMDIYCFSSQGHSHRMGMTSDHIHHIPSLSSLRRVLPGGGLEAQKHPASWENTKIIQDLWHYDNLNENIMRYQEIDKNDRNDASQVVTIPPQICLLHSICLGIRFVNLNTSYLVSCTWYQHAITLRGLSLTSWHSCLNFWKSRLSVRGVCLARASCLCRRVVSFLQVVSDKQTKDFHLSKIEQTTYIDILFVYVPSGNLT